MEMGKAGSGLKLLPGKGTKPAPGVGQLPRLPGERNMHRRTVTHRDVGILQRRLSQAQGLRQLPRPKRKSPLRLRGIVAGAFLLVVLLASRIPSRSGGPIIRLERMAQAASEIPYPEVFTFRGVPESEDASSSADIDRRDAQFWERTRIDATAPVEPRP